MNLSRRHFLSSSAAVLGASAAAAPGVHAGVLERPADPERFDPWVEIDARALAHNVREIWALSGGRPILAVVKNNAYGLGLTTAVPLMDGLDAIAGFAVVKADQAIALRDAGVTKPILLMGHVPEAVGPELMDRVWTWW